MEIPHDVRDLSYEDALAELTALTQKLEQGQILLADALRYYQRAQALAARLEDWVAQLSAVGPS
ncbi:exodeoxyribonuclease VII small subunit [Sulfobacillus thermosulfidooxidans]|uniref:exodeoxyribonuclease VII small subunit n=1 Tax=Sulfobacillus thermosulfidooxidans TaxID=28034 RepID=UPI00031FB5AF|nr:exodeoxyribonuclease VII small subunit [Sulfobacillus thermosulfidooxidans]